MPTAESRPRRFPALATLALAVTLAACGGGSDVTFPSLGAEQDGYPSAPVATEDEANEICNAAQSDWPEEWSDAEGVTFDIPDTEADLVCIRQ